MFAIRRERLVSTFPDGVEWLAVSQPANVTYLTGFTGEASWLLLCRQRAVLVSDGRFESQLAEERPDLEVVIRPPTRTTLETVADILQQAKAGNVGVEATQVTLAEAERLKELAPSITWVPMGGLVERLRRVKDPTEIEAIRASIDVAERAFAMFRAVLTGTESEKELADAMESYVRRAGGSGTSFPPIVAVGARSALPHAPPTDRRVNESPFLLLDWGATHRQYRSDITRIIRTGPRLGIGSSEWREIESRLEKLYTVVLRGQELAIRSIRAGVRAAEVDIAVRRYFEEQGYLREFNHGLGHGIGLQIHEGPSLRPSSPDVLEEGNVVTVEPALYIRGLGGVRIEDDVLVHADGCEVLTRVPKDWSMGIVW
ncbi:MAG: Xaa-Pro peptidase family protein [Gemmataceae bacterium]|nr:Xaa-Pro peptidase family protein [Gemmataceae bacterium]